MHNVGFAQRSNPPEMAEIALIRSKSPTVSSGRGRPTLVEQLSGSGRNHRMFASTHQMCSTTSSRVGQDPSKLAELVQNLSASCGFRAELVDLSKIWKIARKCVSPDIAPTPCAAPLFRQPGNLGRAVIEGRALPIVGVGARLRRRLPAEASAHGPGLGCRWGDGGLMPFGPTLASVADCGATSTEVGRIWPILGGTTTSFWRC